MMAPGRVTSSMSTRARWIEHVSSLLILFGLSVLTPGQSSAPAKSPVGIPGDAIHFKGKWYRVYKEKGGWKRAKERCVIAGGQLALVPDSATQAFIKELAAELPLWLGATDEKTEGVWLWTNGSRMIYDAWEPGQPNNAPRENYLLIARNGLWQDAIEGEPSAFGFICEWNRK
jgi:Lectin C-type domain